MDKIDLIYMEKNKQILIFIKKNPANVNPTPLSFYWEQLGNDRTDHGKSVMSQALQKH